MFFQGLDSGLRRNDDLIRASLGIDQNTSIQLARGTREPFDGVLEVWWTSGEQIAKYAQNPTLKDKLAAMRQLQEEFVDLGSSSFFFASEEEHLGGS
jgi:hypothetical protein